MSFPCPTTLPWETALQKVFLLLIGLIKSEISRPTLGPIQTSIQLVPGILSPRVKHPEQEVDRYAPSSAEVKNECCYTSTPPVCCHGVDRDNFTFILFFHWYPHYLLLLQFCKSCTMTQMETGLLETILHVFHRCRLEVTMV